MHNGNIASGFLYHPPSGKILLQQFPKDRDSRAWSLFSGRHESSAPRDSFRQVLSNQLGTDLDKETIFPVYDYARPDEGETHFIFYAVVNREDLDLNPRPEHKVRWFTPKEILKLELVPQIRHDITIGQRVIGAAERDLENMQSGVSVNEG